MGNTPIKDSDIQCFNTVLTLKELYLECPENLKNMEVAESKKVILEAEASTSSGLTEWCREVQRSTSCSSSSAENFPSHSSFLIGRHRPDQIIYLDVHNSRQAIFIQHNQLGNRQPYVVEPEVIDQVDEVFSYPMLWDLVNPLGRPFNKISYIGGSNGQCNPPSRKPRSTCSPITDRGICCFGRPQRPVEQGTIWVRIVNRPNENQFERLSIRHYRLVTDITLQHLVQCSPNLRYLDLTGTSVTREGVQVFKNSKPDCQIVANHLIG